MTADLKVVDFPLVASCESIVDRTLAIQSKLRVEPVYVGEVPNHEIATDLHSKDFEPIGTQTEFWKCATRHRFSQGHGKSISIYANCLFFRHPEGLRSLPKDEFYRAPAKKILIAPMIERNNHAEHLLENYGKELLVECVAVLEQAVNPKFPTPKQAWAVFRRVLFPLEFIRRYLTCSNRHVATK